MSTVGRPRSFSTLLSDFLLKVSKGPQDLLVDHPLLQVPAIQVLSAEFLADQPACRDWPAIEVAMGTIGAHWERVHKPGQLSVAFRNEWAQYLVLAVAYFIPFRQALTASDARCQHGVYPQSRAKLGELLSDAEFLAGILAEETEGKYGSTRISELCQALIPNSNNQDKGAMPASTVGSRRGVAIDALAASLEQRAARAPATLPTRTLAAPTKPGDKHLEEAVIVPPEAPASSATSLVPLSPHAVVPAQTQVVPLEVIVAGIPDMQEAEIAAACEIVEPVRVLSALVERALTNGHSGPISGTLGDRSRRLAQQLAAIGLSIEPTGEPTTRFTRPNVLLAMSRSGLALDRYVDGDTLMDYLAQIGLLRPSENCWQFAHPALQELFGAEHLADYGQHWVSLRPVHRRLMRWTAAVLARRADDQRNEMFCHDLGQALKGWCQVSLLDMADIVAEFRYHHTPATDRFQAWLVSEIRPLAQIPSGSLQQALWQCGQRLGLDLGVSAPRTLSEVIVSPDCLETECRTTDLPDFLQQLGLPEVWATDPAWCEKRSAINALLDCVSADSESGVRLRAASCLWRSSLQARVGLMVPTAGLGVHRLSGLEAVARLAIDQRVDEATRTLARSALARDEHLLGLAALGQGYEPILVALLIMLDKRVFLDEHAAASRIYSGPNESAVNIGFRAQLT